MDIKSIRNTFKQHHDLYRKGVHYFILEGQELNYFNQKNSNYLLRNIKRAFLWTKIGVVTFLHTLNAQTPITEHNSILQSLFNTSVNEFDVLRTMIDSIEKAQLTANEALDRVQSVEEKIDVSISPADVKAYQIAHHLKLYSKSGLPHTQLISAISKTLNLKKDYKSYYEDDDIKIVCDHIDDDKYWQTYYKPAGAKKIIEWFEKHKADIEYTEYYKRNCTGGKKGDVKRHGYKIGKIRYIVI